VLPFRSPIDRIIGLGYFFQPIRAGQGDQHFAAGDTLLDELGEAYGERYRADIYENGVIAKPLGQPIVNPALPGDRPFFGRIGRSWPFRLQQFSFRDDDGRTTHFDDTASPLTLSNFKRSQLCGLYGMCIGNAEEPSRRFAKESYREGVPANRDFHLSRASVGT
jgi:hypothetical protein